MQDSSKCAISFPFLKFKFKFIAKAIFMWKKNNGNK